MSVRRSDNSDEVAAALRAAGEAARLPDIDITAQLMAAEDDLLRRRRRYPGDIARGRMTQAQSDERIATAAAIVAALKWLCDNADVIRAVMGEGPAVPLGRLPQRFTPAVPFTAMRASAAGEIAARERLYPAWIAEKRITADLADRRIAESAAIHRTLTWFDKRNGVIDAALAMLAGARKEFPDAEIGAGGQVEGRPPAGSASGGGRPGREGHHAG